MYKAETNINSISIQKFIPKLVRNFHTSFNFNDRLDTSPHSDYDESSHSNYSAICDIILMKCNWNLNICIISNRVSALTWSSCTKSNIASYFGPKINFTSQLRINISLFLFFCSVLHFVVYINFEVY